MSVLKLINNGLDKLIRTEVYLFGKRCAAFRVCGLTGALLAASLGMALVSHLQLSLPVLVVLIASAITAFLMLAMSTKVFTGRENMTCYHHQIVVMIVMAALLGYLRQPVLPYLDVMLLSIGLFQACGRVGCLMVGCCHGRPHSFGVCYREEHVAAGFTPCYVGVRLFPVQAVEAVWVLCVVSVGVALVWQGSAPEGTTLSWYVVAYALGRFVFEFARGDMERPYLYGFSEAQWTSLLLVCAVLCAELAGLIVFQLWHVGAVVLLALTMIAIALQRRLRKTNGRKLLHSLVHFQKGERDLAR